MTNLFFIGMPGCGKSSLVKAIGERVKGFTVVDIDAEIEKQCGMRIPKIFAKHGESAFRDMETRQVAAICKKDNQLVSCGGGIVLRGINVNMMRQAGIVIYIDRPLDEIAADVSLADRPLLADGVERLYTLYDQRHKMYEQAAHTTFFNSGDFDTAVENLYKMLFKA